MKFFVLKNLKLLQFENYEAHPLHVPANFSVAWRT